VADHLRALDDYSALLRGSEDVELSEEGRRREKVERTLHSVAELFRKAEEGGVAKDSNTSRLLEAGRAYLAACANRDQMGREFAEGRGDLASLEASIRRQNDASDMLRLAALHLGATI
jgi:hypothetical protein